MCFLHDRIASLAQDGAWKAFFLPIRGSGHLYDTHMNELQRGQQEISHEVSGS